MPLPVRGWLRYGSRTVSPQSCVQGRDLLEEVGAGGVGASEQEIRLRMIGKGSCQVQMTSPLLIVMEEGKDG